MPLPDGAVCTLDDTNLFSYLCVHGASHFWFRLKWLADLNALLAGAGDAQLEDYYRHAQAHGAGVCAAQAVLLCQIIFARPLPHPLAQELQRDWRVRRLVSFALRNMIDRDAAAAPARGSAEQAKETAYRFLLGRGIPFLAAQARLAMVAPADVLLWQLPRPLWFLYPLIRLPSWLKRRRRGRAARASGGAKHLSSRSTHAVR